MMGVKNLSEAVVATDLSVVAKGTKISNIPIAMASAMATALIPGISSDFAQNHLEGVRNKVAKSVKVTMLISIPAAVGIGVLAKPIMMVIFHQKESLDISSMLLTVISVSIIFYALSTLTQAVLQSIGKMNTPIINASIALVIHAALMIVLLLFMDGKFSLYYYVASTILYSLLLCILNGFSVRRYLKYRQETDRTFLRPILASVVMGAVAWGVYHGLYYLCKINIVSLMVAIAVSVSVYFIMIIRWKAVTEEELKSMPKGHMIIGIAKKVGIMKPQRTKLSGTSKKHKKQKENHQGRKRVKEETDDDYWLDE